MYNFDLETRLQRLNPRLYIERRVVNKGLKEFTLTGIYLKQPRRKKINISQADIHYAKDGGDKYLYDIQSGARDELSSARVAQDRYQVSIKGPYNV